MQSYISGWWHMLCEFYLLSAVAGPQTLFALPKWTVNGTHRSNPLSRLASELITSAAAMMLA